MHSNHYDPRKYIIIRGARQHNLKGVDLNLPKGSLAVITGPSGSGKSSLAFSTVYAEGQRRYVESLSAYARQFLERMNKPEVDHIAGLAPAIAIEQRTLTRNPRSTVATQTELYDYFRLLYAQIGITVSPVSGRVVSRDTPESVARSLPGMLANGDRFYVAFPVKASIDPDSLRQRGFTRMVALEGPQILEVNRLSSRKPAGPLAVLVDRLVLRSNDDSARSRLVDSLEQAFREGDGRCLVVPLKGQAREFSDRFERDGVAFEVPTSRMFAFNSPAGACATCQGFGRVRQLDKRRVIPDLEQSLGGGAVAAFHGRRWHHHQVALERVARASGISTSTPYCQLSAEAQAFVWEGKDSYIGILPFMQELERRSYRMQDSIHRARFLGYGKCSECGGYRLRKEALNVFVGGQHIGQLMELTTLEAADFFDKLALPPFQERAAHIILEEIRRRLRFLVNVGLDYLTLGRQSRTLSGGENQRINLATALGSSLVGSLYVLDEPTVGLHPRDTNKLVGVLEHLRDIGNTVIVVEHEPEVIRRADHITDLGPGAGARGGKLMFEGPYQEIIKDQDSLTGAYLSGMKRIPLPKARRVADWSHALVVEGARLHNLKRVTARFPLGVLTCVTGVSGSGKSTLVHETLYKGLRTELGGTSDQVSGSAYDLLRGHGLIGGVEMVDQSPIGRSPRSNPATYTKAFDAIRQLLAGTYQARIRGRKPGYFSFNVPGGRCEGCQGEGVVKVEMQFLADLSLECEDCRGKRYTKDVLEIRYRHKNVDDILRLTVDEAVEFFREETAVCNRLRILQEIGLGYLTLGQPATTLSGGEAQRIKLGAYLARRSQERTLYILDEPTTGLHPDDIVRLLLAFNRLVDQGHTVLVIEHNLDVIKCADWIIDLGPEAGDAGGRVVVEGPPEAVAAHPASHTGRFLRPSLGA